MDVTQSFAATFVDELAAQGIEYACVSPGSRSAPLAMAFQRHPKIRVLMHIDERSGSFFGVGLAKSTGKPVVLLCTSGTAAAEFHAAVVEASYSRTPLIVLTADRPPELQGAPGRVLVSPCPRRSGTIHIQPSGILEMISSQLRPFRVNPCSRVTGVPSPSTK